MSHEEYLRLMLKDKNIKLQHLHIVNEKHMAVHNAKCDMLIAEIESIEKQLSEKK
jgi:hypothetical protein